MLQASTAGSRDTVVDVQQAMVCIALSFHPGTICFEPQNMVPLTSFPGHSRLQFLMVPSFVPRLFLVEEKPWQGPRVIYFRYVMIHVIYSDHALFWKLSCDFCEGMYVVFQTVFK